MLFIILNFILTDSQEKSYRRSAIKQTFFCPLPSASIGVKLFVTDINSWKSSIVEIPVNSIRLAETAKQQLIQLKRNTKIDNWNILCRWALCVSLAEASIPSMVVIPVDSNVEMTWNVFSGEIGDYLLIALKQRCHNDGLGVDVETLKTQLRLHIHRGIGYLAGNSNLKKIDDLVALTKVKTSQSIKNG
jgi:DNA sulfur modification protein DndE